MTPADIIETGPTHRPVGPAPRRKRGGVHHKGKSAGKSPGKRRGAPPTGADLTPVVTCGKFARFPSVLARLCEAIGYPVINWLGAL